MTLAHAPGETVERSDGHRSQLIRSNATIVDLVAENRSLEQSLAKANANKEKYRAMGKEDLRAYNGLV